MATEEEQFDLNKCTEPDTIKKILGYLLKKEKESSAETAKISSALDSTTKEFKMFKLISGKNTGVTSEEIIPIKEKLTKIEGRVYGHDESFAAQQVVIDSTCFNFKMMQFTVNDHESRLAEFDKIKEENEANKKVLDDLLAKAKQVDSIKIEGDEGNKINKYLEIMKSELLESFAKKEEFNKLENLIKQNCEMEKTLPELEGKVAENTIEMKTLHEYIKQLEHKISSKVESTVFDNLLASLNQFKASMGVSLKDNKPTITNPIDILQEKIKILEIGLDELMKKNPVNSSIEQKQLSKTLEKIKPSTAMNDINSGNIEEELKEIKQILDRVKKDLVDIRKELDVIKDFKKKLNNFEIMIDDKIARKEFSDYKQQNETANNISTIIKKFADRNEVFKNFRRVENKLQTIELLMEKEGVLDPYDNALVSKRQNVGWSCPSCQKDLGIVQGTTVPYCIWNKYPKRNATERIPNVGNGFSKVLTMLKPGQTMKSPQTAFVQHRILSPENSHLPLTKGVEKNINAQRKTAGSSMVDLNRPDTAAVYTNLAHAKKKGIN